MRQITELCRGWIDESGSNQTHDPGSYILASAICPCGLEEDVRQTMNQLTPRGAAKLHWHHENDARRHDIITAIAEFDLLHLVVVRVHQPQEKSERRRRKCLELLVPRLEGRGITDLVLESRGRPDDRKDLDMLNALRSQHRAATTRFRHEIGRGEPMLAIPDAVCGAVTAARIGDHSYQDLLGEQLTIIEI